MPKILDPTPEEIAQCVKVVEDGGRALAARFYVESHKVPATDKQAKRFVSQNWAGFVPEAMRIINFVFGSLVKEPRVNWADFVMAGEEPSDLPPMGNYTYDHAIRDAKLLARIHDASYLLVEIEPDHWIICRTTPKDRVHDALWVLPNGETQSFAT